MPFNRTTPKLPDSTEVLKHRINMAIMHAFDYSQFESNSAEDNLVIINKMLYVLLGDDYEPFVVERWEKLTKKKWNRGTHIGFGFLGEKDE